MPAKRIFARTLIFLCYAVATLQFIRFYVVSTTFYLNMPEYLAGHERLPFQERVLPIFFISAVNHSSFLLRHLSHPDRGWDSASASSPQNLGFYLLALVSFSIAGFLVVRLYRAVNPNGALAFLVYPLFMVLTLWTYVVHIDADFSYPYDMPSLAFFAGGMLAIYTRRYIPLLLIMFFGTMNRETTLFLVVIFILDAASRTPPHLGETHSPALPPASRFDLAQVPWLRTAGLFLVWLVVKFTIHRHFAGNDRSEDYLRLGENLHRLTPRLWPILFNVCGYLLPVVFVLRDRLRPTRFANYLYVLPFWFAAMFCTGVILETRIYGELCAFTAVASVLLVEDHLVGKQAHAHSLEASGPAALHNHDPSPSWKEVA